MVSRLRRNLNYANVMATLAVFIGLGGSSYAALKLTGHDIRDGSLTGRDLKPNSVGSKRIRESTLDTVRRSRNSERVGGLRAEQLLVRCPSGTAPVSDACLETRSRPPAPYGTAAVECEATDARKTPGRRLPSHDELMTAIGDYGITLAPGGELTRNVYPSATQPGRVDVLYITDDVGSVALTPDTAAGAKAFRCVTDPIN
jgi:hypothetical protein